MHVLTNPYFLGSVLAVLPRGQFCRDRPATPTPPDTLPLVATTEVNMRPWGNAEAGIQRQVREEVSVTKGRIIVRGKPLCMAAASADLALIPGKPR